MTAALTFVAAWGMMMTAMMLPSALPMILLYRTVSRRLSASGDKSIPAWLFALVYLLVWMLIGVPVYAGYLIFGDHALVPYVVAASLAAAGLYQFTSAKRVCLRYCEAPLSFLMRRWRSGYRATLRLALAHAAYCVGCCWALMVILVVAGAMSMPWVIAIAVAVFAEKMLPRPWRMANLIGIVLILLGIAVALRPGLTRTLRGSPMEMQM